MSIEKFNTITRENIRKMVLEFYVGMLFEDNHVSEIFKRELGEDITTDHWQEHFDILTNFWSMIVLKDNHYYGNPMDKHMKLPLNKEMFVTWLEMFFEIIDSRYEEHLAKVFKTKADNIANSFMRMLNL